MTRALKIRFLKYSHAQHTVKYKTTHTNTNHQHYRTNKTVRQTICPCISTTFFCSYRKLKKKI